MTNKRRERKADQERPDQGVPPAESVCVCVTDGVADGVADGAIDGFEDGVCVRGAICDAWV